MIVFGFYNAKIYYRSFGLCGSWDRGQVYAGGTPNYFGSQDNSECAGNIFFMLTEER